MKGYTQIYDGDWVQPTMRNHRVSCCDCGLVHSLNFRAVDAKTGARVKGARVELQVFRHSRATAGMRAAQTRRKTI